MKKVIVHHQKCIGCMQCMAACATAHSISKTLFAAALESPLPRSRIYIGVGLYNEGFPNRCRHCDPAPCMTACLSGAILRDEESESVLINPDKCINCASCAMACPFGVIRFYEDQFLKKTIAIKCDNCLERQNQGKPPACVEACKTNALTFEEQTDALKRKTNMVAKSISQISDDNQVVKNPFKELIINKIKRDLIELNRQNV